MAEHKTVFISYRRTNIYIARAVYQDLRANGYDVFLDYQSIDSGDFSQVILNQIAARAHFVLILTPSALERCVNSDDMVRQEIEHAIALKRNVVPLIFEGFDYKVTEPYLASESLKRLPKYNGLHVPDDYFEEAMVRLRTRFLSLPVEGVLHPTPKADQSVVRESIQQAEAEPIPTAEQLQAEEYFEQGFSKHQQNDYRGAIDDFTQAINRNPRFSEAYYRRGLVYSNVGDKQSALQDWQQATILEPDHHLINIIQSKIYLAQGDFNRALAEAEQGVNRNPGYAEAYSARGLVHYRKGNMNEAIEDFDEAIRLNPHYARIYNNRGNALAEKSQLDAAIQDYTQALRLNPQFAEAYSNRGIVRKDKSDFEGAIADYNEAIRLNPSDAEVYNNRANVYFSKGDLDSAIADYEAALRINPDFRVAEENLKLTRRKKQR
jgi:tetratricopeptide (TPR) repeat protein